MTDKLTDEDICRLMGWLQYPNGRWEILESIADAMPRDYKNGTSPCTKTIKTVPTPDFSDERNIFKWVVPWANGNGWALEIVCKGNGKKGAGFYVQQTGKFLGTCYSADSASDAVREALAQMKK